MPPTRATFLRRLLCLELIQIHETVLFLRAYPQGAEVLRHADRILFLFGERLRGMPREDFEYSEISGIAGTGLTTNFSYPFAKSLAEWHAGCVSIDWEQYQHADRLGPILARLIPESFEDWAVSPHPDWRRWYEKAGGTLPWLLRGVTPEVYDLLELPRPAPARARAPRSRRASRPRPPAARCRTRAPSPWRPRSAGP